MATRRLPLRGADLVLLAMQALWNREGASNNALLVVECDGPIAPERVQRALDRLLDLCPWPAARLRRPFPWGGLYWAAGPRSDADGPSVRRQSLAGPTELHEALETDLNTAIDPRREPPVRITVIDETSKDARAHGGLILSWFHPLMDPRGAQNFLTHLARLDEGDGPIAWAGGPPDFVQPPDRRPLRERGRLGRQSLAYMRTLADLAPVSPGTALPWPGRARFRQDVLVEREPANGNGRAPSEIGRRLAVVGKAMAQLWRRRGLPDEPFLVPIAVDLRPKGDPGPTFGNQLGFHFARFRPSETADVAGLAKVLRDQMADAVRDGQIEANAVAMDFLKYRPVSRMLRELPGTARRETFSFNCADVGDMPHTLSRLFGRRVLNAYHVPTVLPRPGIGVFFNRCAGTTNVVASWIEGAVSEDEVLAIMEAVREAAAWT